jgi:hypothetical protein
MDIKSYYYYCGSGGKFILNWRWYIIGGYVSFCRDISNPSTLVDTRQRKGDAAAYLFKKKRETKEGKRRRRRRRKVCRLKSFVRLLISNCHPSLAPPLGSHRLFFSSSYKEEEEELSFSFSLFLKVKERKQDDEEKYFLFYFISFSSTSFVVLFCFVFSLSKTKPEIYDK